MLKCLDGNFETEEEKTNLSQGLRGLVFNIHLPQISHLDCCSHLGEGCHYVWYFDNKEMKL